MEESSCAAVVLGDVYDSSPSPKRTQHIETSKPIQHTHIVDTGKNGQKKKTTSVSEGETQIETR